MSEINHNVHESIRNIGNSLDLILTNILNEINKCQINLDRNLARLEEMADKMENISNNIEKLTDKRK